MDKVEEDSRWPTLVWYVFSGFLPVRVLKSPCVFISHPQHRDPSPMRYENLSDYLQLPQYLWTGIVVHAKTHPVVYWMSWRTFWALIVNTSFQCCNSERNSLWTHICMNLFSHFDTRIPSPKFVHTFQIHPVICAAMRGSEQKCMEKGSEGRKNSEHSSHSLAF
jgi:hypothetical protein